jgi:hypothetical protein
MSRKNTAYRSPRLSSFHSTRSAHSKILQPEHREEENEVTWFLAFREGVERLSLIFFVPVRKVAGPAARAVAMNR